MRRLAPAVLFLALAACDGSVPELREEVWRIDFETHADEVEATLSAQGHDAAEVAFRALERLNDYYRGLAIRFELGPGSGSGRAVNSICVRNAPGTTLGRGVLDLGNRSVDHLCGEYDGLPLGVFVDNTVDAIIRQGVEPDLEVTSRTLAVVLAHEIGHALGLVHTPRDSGLGDIMYPSLDARTEVWFFLPAAIAQLEANLPTPAD
jgi:hypothetical protein